MVVEFVAVAVAFLSASQDVVIDAYRTDVLPAAERGREPLAGGDEDLEDRRDRARRLQPAAQALMPAVCLAVVMPEARSVSGIQALIGELRRQSTGFPPKARGNDTCSK